MKITARFTKKYVTGLDAGFETHETMTFNSVKHAEAWKKAIDACGTLSWVVEDFYIEAPAQSA